VTPRERLDAIEARMHAAAASSPASAATWWAARSRLTEKDVPDLVAFARAVLDAADAVEAPIKGPLPPSRVVANRVIRALADEHLGVER